MSEVDKWYKKWGKSWDVTKKAAMEANWLINMDNIWGEGTELTGSLHGNPADFLHGGVHAHTICVAMLPA